MSLQLKEIVLTLGAGAAKVNILKSLSLEIQQGEVVGIVGASGSGKSSLMMLMGGLEAPTSGDIHFNDEVLTNLSENALASWRSKNVGIVFQSFHLIETLSALDNVALPLVLAKRKDAYVVAEQELKLVGLGHRLTHLPTELSGGEQQRVALARAFAPRPKLILADEPTGNLDATTGSTIISLMFQRQKEVNATLILITHDKVLASQCQRVITLSSGEIASDKTSGLIR